MKNLAIFALCMSAAVGLPVAPAAAQTWTPPDDLQTAQAGGGDAAALVEEIKKQLDRGEKERLADPWFLRDLRAILDRYDWPWRVRLLSEDFSDRGPRPPAPWRVTAGEFLIDWRFGMRSVVEPPKQQATTQRSGTRGQDDAVKQLLGTLLQQSLGGQKEAQQAETAPPSGPGYAAVIAQRKLSNAFAAEIEMTSRAVQGLTEGRFEFGPYQGANASAGYRLAYVPGARAGTPSWELLKLSSRGTTSTLELYDQPIDLEDGQAHKLLWTRTKRGVMVVSLDGKELFRVTDRSFRDPFDGFAVVNSGGDFAIRRIVIDGAG